MPLPNTARTRIDNRLTIKMRCELFIHSSYSFRVYSSSETISNGQPPKSGSFLGLVR
jgi:hypothetical protein